MSIPQYHKNDTIVISDFHLGTKNAKVEKLSRFLTVLLENPPHRVIVAGDAFEFWSTNYKNIGRQEHQIVTKLSALSELGTKLVYIPGNHDRAFRAFSKFAFGKIKICSEYIIRSDHKKYLVLHGDEFDSFTRNHVVISILLDQLYILLVKVSVFARRFFGKKKSLSSKKHSSKYGEIVEKIRALALAYARSRKFNGIIMGHTHWPELVRNPDDLIYANCGDWIDNCSFVVVGEDVTLQYFK
ncbi:MAG: metallophosphoesterase [uncultured bacterium]|nr:MAG: metallophosphoesterase [uncultured bacterium]